VYLPATHLQELHALHEPLVRLLSQLAQHAASMVRPAAAAAACPAARARGCPCSGEGYIQAIIPGLLEP
jgi:hypothetical protein